MMIAVASDLHDNLNNWQKLIQELEQLKITTLLLTGDLGNEQTIKHINHSFSGKLFVIRGNADIYSEEKLAIRKSINYLGLTGTIKLANLKIGLAHEPWRAKDLLNNNPDLDFIFYGHTHKPWINKIKNCYLVNSGNLQDNYLATFACLDTKTKRVSLKKLK